ncbi:competence type IV pilus major pilin ComGC [Alkalihalobacterium bogoriense]|uniref:competence type IV pilus major pilin ComGC n=1 Tax=Alkalihalobacterium bogoriense TaxID=246272 RepID=UPI00047CB961|nr:competence type IV pilus major pilin ComGC [Alkalihalobacterium bogoriense]
MKKLLKKQAGFTLIEMMIVLLIISILLLIAVPNMTKNTAVAGDKSCDATIKLLQTQVGAYEVEKGSLPASLQALQDEGYVDNITCPNNETLSLNTNGVVVKSPSN